MVRTVALFFTLLLPVICFSQKGYVKPIGNDSVFIGYIRSFRTVHAEPGYTIWKTKKVSSSRRFLTSQIREFAYRRDTFRVLNGVQSFGSENVVVLQPEARRVVKGRINLYVAKQYGRRANVGIMGLFNDMLALEDPATGTFTALPAEPGELRNTLLLFFSEKFLSTYETKVGPIGYKKVYPLILFYNYEGHPPAKLKPLKLSFGNY